MDYVWLAAIFALMWLTGKCAKRLSKVYAAVAIVILALLTYTVYIVSPLEGRSDPFTYFALGLSYVAISSVSYFRARRRRIPHYELEM
jgi:hypothetical protein